MYKADLKFNNQQWLICHKTKLNQTKILCAGEVEYADCISAER